MATKQTSSTPSSFNFLKEGLLLPNHNRRLFAAVLTFIAASTCLLLLVNDLAVEPLIIKPRAAELVRDTMALNGTDPSSPDFLQLTQKTQHDSWALLLAEAANLVFSTVIKSAVHIVVLFAAVATCCSGELHTFRSLLAGKVISRATQLKGPVLTLAFVYAQAIAYVALLLVTGTLAMALKIVTGFGFWFVVASLLVLALVVFLVCFFFLGSVGVVVAVAEPGCHGAAALGRAWRLMKGKRGQAVLFMLVTGVLAAALSPFYGLARRCALANMGAGLLLGFLYIVLAAAVQLFAACAMTALYYEGRTAAEASELEYVKVSTKEQFDA